MVPASFVERHADLLPPMAGNAIILLSPPQWLNGQSKALLTLRLGVRFPPGAQKENDDQSDFANTRPDRLLR